MLWNRMLLEHKTEFEEPIILFETWWLCKSYTLLSSCWKCFLQKNKKQFFFAFFSTLVSTVFFFFLSTCIFLFSIFPLCKAVLFKLFLRGTVI